MQRSSSPLTILPSSISRLILTFVTSPYNTDTLRSIAHVSHEWKQIAYDVAGENILSKLTISSESVCAAIGRRDFLELRRQLTLRRAFLHTLSLHLEYERKVTMTSLRHWHAVLAMAPRLKELDLSGVPRHQVEYLASIIRAARARCPDLHMILIPNPQSLKPTARMESNAALLLEAVCGAGGGYHTNNSLRELMFSVPFITFPRPSVEATRFVNAICDGHPQLEALFANARQDDAGDIQCNDQWWINETTWERFCATCTSLTYLSWINVPFKSSFFEIFARYPKPKLQKLILATPTKWDWDAYHRQVRGGEAAGDATDFGHSARGIHQILEACPALLSLSALLPSAQDGRTPKLDPEIFGDVFVQHAHRHCPQLERVEIYFEDKFAYDIYGYPYSVTSLTSASLTVMSLMPRLRFVELPPACITGGALFDLVTNLGRYSSDANLQREFSITVGDKMGTWSFYNVVESFLVHAALHNGNMHCAGRPVALRLCNGDPASVDPVWCATYFKSGGDGVEATASDQASIAHAGLPVRSVRARQGHVSSCGRVRLLHG